MFLDLLKQLLDYNGVEPPEIKTLMREFDESVQVYFIKSLVMNKGNLINHLLSKSISHNNIDSLMSGGSDSNNRRDMVVLDMQQIHPMAFRWPGVFQNLIPHSKSATTLARYSLIFYCNNIIVLYCLTVVPIGYRYGIDTQWARQSNSITMLTLFFSFSLLKFNVIFVLKFNVK